MKKTFSLMFFICFVILCSFLVTESETYDNDEHEEKSEAPYSIGDEDDPQARLNWEFERLRDPVTNKIPENIRQKELLFAAGLPKRRGDDPNALVWSERGPNNVGGRTKALMYDVNDTSIIIAGGISGGIWRSTNSGVNWVQRTTPAQLHNATSISQDRRPSHTNTWYVGTGEVDGNTAGQFNSGNPFTGDGIFKSVDNGLTWNLIPSTSGNPPYYVNSNWQFVWNVATDQSNASQDEVYAATIGSIYRSSNGGTDWAQVLGSSTNRSYFTDVQCGATGVVYATGSYTASGAMNGIYRSPDGITWTNIMPASFPATWGRIVVAIAPSNENVVYFAVHNVPNGAPNSINKHQLWKYHYLGGDGAGSNGIWTALGGNLPQPGQSNFGPFNEPFDTQDGYDLTMQVSPSDTNFVILSAVNSYRTTDGFAAIGNTKRIGGYLPNAENDQYPNSHPDHHTGFFIPGTTVFYQGHDGGISRTEDIAANDSVDTPVTWKSLSGSYNVTQFYAIGMDPETGSKAFGGGFQDNGSFLTNSDTLTTPWLNIYSGDGGYFTIAPLTDDRIYVTAQEGIIARAQRDGENFTNIKPTGAGHQSFINPHALDMNNSSLFYYAGGTNSTTTGIWRNNDITNATVTNGWSYLAGTDVGNTSAEVSVISVSKANSTNVVYYGTNRGHIRRIDDANTTATVSADLNTDSMPSGANVSSIAIDPTNSSHVIAVFSNYNVKRIWYSTDAGDTWTNIEGNLEGTDGPSCRWATIFYKSGVLHVMLATSIGVFYTTEIDGSSTVWTQEAVTSIGNVVTTMFDYRSSDNTLVAGTHGRGSFSTVINAPMPVELLAFNSEISGQNVMLKWTTGTETNNSGFVVQRKTGNADWADLGFVRGLGNSNSSYNYSFSDNNLQTGKYKYRLKQTDFNGNFEYHYLAGEVSIGLPNSFALRQNYPNPFNPATKIEFSLPSNGNVMLKIYDITGKEVARLINNEFRNAGTYTMDFNGSFLASGVYFYKLEAGSFTGMKKMMLIK